MILKEILQEGVVKGSLRESQEAKVEIGLIGIKIRNSHEANQKGKIN